MRNWNTQLWNEGKQICVADFYPTYEELKPQSEIVYMVSRVDFYPTYEELKLNMQI